MTGRKLIFPAALALMNFGAAVMAFLARDWKGGLYWVFSGCCIVAFTLK